MADASDSRPGLVSVLVASYDHLRYLPVAVESALRQTYANLEVIVTDDASPQDPREALSGLLDDPRVRYHRSTVRRGMAGNHLLASEQASGEYIAILNDDDVWEPRFLERLLDPLRNRQDVAVAFCDGTVITAEGTIDVQATEEATHRWKRDRLPPGLHRPFCSIGLVDQSVSMAVGSVIRRSAVEWSSYSTESGSTYDLWITYLACRSGLGAFYVPERLVRYRAHAGGETASSRLRVSSGAIHCYGAFLRDPALAAFHGDFRRRLGRAHAVQGIELLMAGRHAQARHHLASGLRRDPRQWRAAAGLLLSLLPGSVTRRSKDGLSFARRAGHRA